MNEIHNNSSSLNKDCGSKCETSISSKSLSPQPSMPGGTVCHSSKQTEQSSTPAFLNFCEVRNQPSTILTVTSTPNQVTDDCKTALDISSNIQCIEKPVSTSNSSNNNYYSLISDTSFTALNIRMSNEDITPLIVDATSSARSLSRGEGSAVVRNIIHHRSKNEASEKNKRKRKRSIFSVINSCAGQAEKDDDVISISDDEISIIKADIIPNSIPKIKNSMPPYKRQKTCSEVPVIDLCTPSGGRERTKMKEKRNKWRKEKLNNRKQERKNKRLFQLQQREEIISTSQPSVNELHSRILHPRNLPIQNQVPSIQPKKLKWYKSILGTVQQRGPFPHASSTITSSTVNNEAVLRRDVNSAEGSSSTMCDNNIYNPNPTEAKTGLRPIVIDGCNVAYGHANGAYFSSIGLKFCIDYFLKRNHKVLAFVPKFRKHHHATKDPQLLEELERKGLVSFTPSRNINGKLVTSYDDRYIVQYAVECGGVIISTDNYNDLIHENPKWKETIENRLLQFTWAGDILLFPQDPLGRFGPNLDQFLRFP
ncbi:hypothetical protein L9F63_007688 [Diploptera punctata]|uniref:RNase NYN domain-containing protein n=1 Tax=Diploptera punctata TaxID=6984 RepID=A0AAD7Z8N5_DIPPU|nr:hypothetical protein L9F63_007688 [Diploptera punctata]